MEAPKPKKEALPTGISLLEAYTKIRGWCRANINLLEGKTDEDSVISHKLIQNLPEPPSATELEMWAVLGEVKSGYLEWAHDGFDGEYKMDAYAHAALVSSGGIFISGKEHKELKSSVLWPYLPSGRAANYFEQGLKLQSASSFKEALDFYKQSLNIQREIGDRAGEAKTLHQIGRVCEDTDRFDDALDYYKHSLKIKREIGDRAGEAKTLHQIGRAYQHTNRFDDALEYYNQSLKIRRELGDRDGELEILDQGLRIKQKIGDHAGELETLNQIGKVYQETNHFNEAIRAYEEVLSISRDLVDWMAEQRILSSLGTIYEKIGKKGKAIELYQHAVQINRNGFKEDAMRFAEPLADTLLNLSRVLEATGQKKNAQAAMEEAHNLTPDLKKQKSKPSHTPTPEMVVQADPTPKVVSDQWVRKDTLGYESYARTIASLITHDETKPPLTIGIKAPWGSGKTSLMKMVQEILDGDAAITEENSAERSNRGEASFTLKGILEGLKETTNPDRLQPKESEKGRLYKISPRATVWFNAWKYQTSEQIWAGLAHCIISQIAARLPKKKREVFWLKLHARRVDVAQVRQQAYQLVFREFLPKGLAYGIGLVLFLIVSILSKLGYHIPELGTLGITLGGVLHGLSTMRDKFSEKVSGSFRDLVREPNYEGKMGFLHLVESDVREVLDLVATPESPLVIFVDDLDRCDPSKVAEVVQAINLFLSGDYPNCIFVLGMEPSMVAAALEVANKDIIKKLEELSLVDGHVPVGWRFMEKIIQLPIVVPPPTDLGVKGYIDDLIGSSEADSSVEPVIPEEEPPEEDKVKSYTEQFKDFQSVTEVVQKTDELFEKSETKDKSAIAEASKRVYSQKFKDRDPVIRNFIESAVALFQANPRQIKRYVNIFRFSSTIRHVIALDRTLLEGKRPKMPSDEALTKFVALNVHWPQATDCLWKMIKNNKDKAPKVISLLTFLEDEARILANKNDKQGDEGWAQFLKEEGLDFGGWVRSRQFREFLAKGESLAGFEGCGLW
jgi:tetratricopeptide (TPR) repeat protein